MVNMIFDPVYSARIDDGYLKNLEEGVTLLNKSLGTNMSVYDYDKQINPNTYKARWGEGTTWTPNLTGSVNFNPNPVNFNQELQNLHDTGFLQKRQYDASPVISPTPTLSEISNQFQNKPVTNTVTSQTTAQPPGTTLSTLYPRQNWSNYQTTNRGSRYFDKNTGRYGLNQNQNGLASLGF